MKRERTCIGCRKTASKGVLYRICRDSLGTVALDRTGNRPGRGAYVCSVDCLDAAASARRLSAALRCKIDQKTQDDILRDLKEAVHAEVHGCEGC